MPKLPLLTTVPPVAVAVGREDRVLDVDAVAAVAAVVGASTVTTTTVVPPPAASAACSDAPLSVPQLLLNQLMTCWLSLVLVHEASQIPAGELYRVVRYPDWQKQAQILWSVVVMPPHACAA